MSRVGSVSPSYIEFVEPYSEIIDGVAFGSHTVEAIFSDELWLCLVQGI